jgi:hypothetical protein
MIAMIRRIFGQKKDRFEKRLEQIQREAQAYSTNSVEDEIRRVRVARLRMQINQALKAS